MAAPIHKVFVEDGQLHHIASRDMIQPSISIYEVIRLINSIPLFFEDHLDRWARSAGLLGKELPLEPGRLLISIYQLANLNGIHNGNIKLVYAWPKAEGNGRLYAFFIPHVYPTERDYQEGVSVGLLEGERSNPGAKVDHTDIRRQAEEHIHRESVYETLFVDHQGYLTEGSRSNCFFIRKEGLFTPPATSVLPGITRQKVLAVCEGLGIPISEELVHRKDLPEIEALFLTGTSPGVLPVAKVGQRSFPPGHKWITQVRNAYEEEVRAYLRSFNPSF